MKCLKCKAEMEKGFISKGIWILEETLRGKVQRFPYVDWLSRLLLSRSGVTKAEHVNAWKCPKCGKIELYSGS